MKVVIVDTGCANIASVAFAVQRLGYTPEVSADAAVLKSADKVILPGVGTAQAAMAEIEHKQLTHKVRDLTQPVLGICLGMQLLCAESEETQAGSPTQCLDLIPTNVSRMSAEDVRLPHMGWNRVTQLCDSPLFEDIEQHSYFYFVHSYSVPKDDYTLASCDYGTEFSAIVQQDNFYGAQFHPERSGQAGAQLLRNFIQKV